MPPRARVTRRAIKPPRASHRSDAHLVRDCLGGSEDAWAALLDKYKNLVFSIPIKRGIPRDDAADIFQRVCLLLMAELPHLREPKALPMWLIKVTSHECLRWQRQEHPYAARAASDVEQASLADERARPEELLEQARQEQMLREAVSALPPRCRELIQMLFFETPARPYRDVAGRLGLAAGSVGFIRGRCLARLRRTLEKMGLS
jgi:RNA polymerase sigma factor (sigma-70 family)